MFSNGTHPGSAVGLDRNQAIEWIAEGLNQVIENTKGMTVKIALETMAEKEMKLEEHLKKFVQLLTESMIKLEFLYVLIRVIPMMLVMM